MADLTLWIDQEISKLKSDGTYLKGAINFLVNEKLKEFAEGLKAFGEKKEALNHERLLLRHINAYG